MKELVNLQRVRHFILTRFTKRQKFIFATVILLAGIIFIRLGFFEEVPWRARVGVFGFVSVIITLFALWDEDFNGIEFVMLPVLPVLFALGSVLVYPLLPSRLDSFFTFRVSEDTGILFVLVGRIIFLGIFVIGYYASLLTSNIFNVAAVRGIQLLRVAHSIGFLITVSCALMLYLVIASFHLPYFVNFVSVFLVSLALTFQALWSVNLERGVQRNVIVFSLVISLVLAEVSWALSFWPVAVSIFALFLTAIFYEAVGIVQYYLVERLSWRVANEFVFVAIAVLVLTVFTTVWGV